MVAFVQAGPSPDSKKYTHQAGRGQDCLKLQSPQQLQQQATAWVARNTRGSQPMVRGATQMCKPIDTYTCLSVVTVGSSQAAFVGDCLFLGLFPDVQQLAAAQPGGAISRAGLALGSSVNPTAF
jgi:hypothetical protein